MHSCGGRSAHESGLESEFGLLFARLQAHQLEVLSKLLFDLLFDLLPKLLFKLLLKLLLSLLLKLL